MIDADTERAAALVRQYPIDHPPMLDRWPYADVPRHRPQPLSHDLAVIALVLLLIAVCGLFGGLH